MNMTKITISKNCGGNGNNASLAVADALKKLNSTGERILCFEKGEYHFYNDGTVNKFFAVSNNSACNKNIAMLIENTSDITIDGNNSVFVFHDMVFPIIVSNSKNITLKNIIFDRAYYPCAIMKIQNITDEGFEVKIDKNKNPYYTENGTIVFKREWGELSGVEKIFAFHATERFHIEFLLTGGCKESPENLAAPYIWADASETENGIYCKYRTDKNYSLGFCEGETVETILDGGLGGSRDTDLIFIDKSENIKVSGIKVRRGVGMGIIAQLSRNIEIDSFCTEQEFYNEHSTLTADAMHFVNCGGMLEIHNCVISGTSDDVINVHGMYTVVENIDKNVIYAKIKHHEQRKFLPYEKSDRIVIIDSETLAEVAEFTIDEAEFTDSCGYDIKICGSFTKKCGDIRPGFLIELPDKMPDLHLHDNDFSDYPNMRISGAGNILIENNRLKNSVSALTAMDLAKYWYESGRIKNLVFKNNYLDNCNGKSGESFIVIGVDGIDGTNAENCPKIHKRIEISDNIFKNIKNHAIFACGVENLVIKNNIFENLTEELMVVDGCVLNKKTLY